MFHYDLCFSTDKLCMSPPKWLFDDSCILSTSKTTLVMKCTLTELSGGLVRNFRRVLRIFPIHPHFVTQINLHELETRRYMHVSPLLHQTPDRISLGLQDFMYLSVNYLSIRPIIHHYSLFIQQLLHSYVSPFFFFAIWMLCSLCYVVCEFVFHLPAIQNATNRLDGIWVCLCFIFSLFLPSVYFHPYSQSPTFTTWYTKWLEIIFILMVCDHISNIHQFKPTTSFTECKKSQLRVSETQSGLRWELRPWVKSCTGTAQHYPHSR